MGKWTSVKERLPVEDLRVLVCCKTQKGVRSINLAYQEKGFWHGSGSMSNVTHWMMLPELPAENETLHEKIEAYAKRQREGERLVCPRCGENAMYTDLHCNSLSRRADIYICSVCGMEEAMNDMRRGRRMDSEENETALLLWAIAEGGF